jgi:hypothetical protein
MASGGRHGRDDFYTPLPGPREARRYIHFFHRVKRLNLSSDGAFVETISLDRHAEIIRPPYQPLLAAGDSECWPSEPKWEMLRDGDELRAKGIDFESVWCPYHVGEVTLSRARDFDLAVLGIPPAAAAAFGTGFQSEHRVAGYGRPHKFRCHAGVPAVAFTNTRKPRLVAGADRDGQLCRAVRLLGRHVSSAGARIVPVGDRPRSIEYFCGSMASPPAPPAEDCRFVAGQSQVVAANAKAWLAADVGYLWPKAAVTAGKPGTIVSSHYHANIDPSELYVQSFPARFNTGSTRPSRSLAISMSQATGPCRGSMAAPSKPPLNRGCARHKQFVVIREASSVSARPKSPLPAFTPHAVDSRSATGANSSRTIACC